MANIKKPEGFYNFFIGELFFINDYDKIILGVFTEFHSSQL
jgi:hypothetical protein